MSIRERKTKEFGKLLQTTFNIKFKKYLSVCRRKYENSDWVFAPLR